MNISLSCCVLLFRHHLLALSLASDTRSSCWQCTPKSLPEKFPFVFSAITLAEHSCIRCGCSPDLPWCRYSTKLLAWTPDNPLRNAANAGLIAVIFAKHGTKKYTCWAESQARYMLGSGPRSFVVGFGNNYPKQSLDKVGCKLPSKSPRPWTLIALSSFRVAIAVATTA